MHYTLPLLLVVTLYLSISVSAADTSAASQSSNTVHNVSTAATADSQTPILGNTRQGDRLLLREISDQHIHANSGVKSVLAKRTTASADSGTQPPRISPAAWELVQQSARLEIPDHELVAYYRKKYQQEAIWVSKIFARATPFIGFVVDALDTRYLPLELALLPAIESGYRPDVHSSKDAAGIWQIIPSTAADMGITHTQWFDGRADIQQSTAAAVEYLGYLNAEFNGDWLLTLAAYNAGLGRVRTAVNRNIEARLPADFWSLKLPEETRHYVPKFLALVAMLRYDRPAGLIIPTISRGSAFDLVDTRQRLSLNRLASLTGINQSHLSMLNAGLVREITPPDGPHLVYVPQGYGTVLINKMIDESDSVPVNPPGTHRVVAGDTIHAIARSYALSQKRLMQLNELESDVIRVGQTLWVLDNESASSRVEYVVSIGDTLSDIAQRFSMRISDIRDAQGEQLENDTIHPGETLSLLAPADASQDK